MKTFLSGSLCLLLTAGSLGATTLPKPKKATRPASRLGGSAATCTTVNTNCACNKATVQIDWGGIPYTTSFNGTLSLNRVSSGFTSAGDWWAKFALNSFGGTAVEPTLGLLTVFLDATRTSTQSYMESTAGLASPNCFPAKHDLWAFTQATVSSTPGITYRSLQEFHMQNNAIPSFGIPSSHITYNVLNDVDFEDPANPGVVVFTVKATPVVINP